MTEWHRLRALLPGDDVPVSAYSTGDRAVVTLYRRLIRRSFEAWCRHALEPLGQEPARHHLLLIRALQAVADGDVDRLMVLMPPGSAKSVYASVLFPAWLFCTNLKCSTIAASYGQDLAESFGRKVRDHVSEHATYLGYGLRADNKSASRWATDQDGSYMATGVCGPITGRRADVVIIDDPVKGEAEADSPTSRAATWAWYQSNLYTRLKPGGRVVLIQTRWHEDDLAGKLLAEADEGGDQWNVLRLPALADRNDDPLGRAPGEPLWPEWENAEALARKRKVVGERPWAALYQQNPQPMAGSIILRHWWQPWLTDPRKLERPDQIILSVDTAYTDKEQNDASACTVWYVMSGQYMPPPGMRPGDPVETPDMRTKALLRFAWNERLEFHRLVEQLTETVETFGLPGVPLRVLVEAKASGISVIQEMRRRMPQITVHAVVPKGDKVARAHAVTALFEHGRVFALARDEGRGPEFRPWGEMVVDQCASFPVGAHDDLCDSVTMALRFVRDQGAEFFVEDARPSRLRNLEPLF